MKTNVLIASALLLSGVTFAQDANTKNEATSKVQIKSGQADNQASASNSVTSTVSASAATSAVNKAATKADRTKRRSVNR